MLHKVPTDNSNTTQNEKKTAESYSALTMYLIM